MMRFPARFSIDAEDAAGRYLVHLPGVGGGDGIYTCGDTLEQAREMAREALTGVLLTRFDLREEPEEPGALPEGGEWEWVRPEPEVEVAMTIRRLRRERGWSQREAAERLGVSHATYRRWEDPERCSATIGTLERIASLHGMALEIEFRRSA